MAALVTDRPGTVAKVRFVRMSASKVRVVMNLIRNKSVTEALEILDFGERLAASEVAKGLRSAIANADHNEDIPAEELFVAACFADEGPTLKRFRPRARGRAGPIHKQTCHITIEVRRYTDDEILDQQKIEELKATGREKRGAKKTSKAVGGDRSKRVAKSKQVASETPVQDVEVDDGVAEDSAVEDVVVEDTPTKETATEETAADEVDVEVAAAEEEVAEDVEVAEDEIVDEATADQETEEK